VSCSDDLDGIEIKIWQDPSGELTALQSGASDLMALTPYDALDDIRRNPNLQVLTSRSAAYDAMHMRVDTPPFDNPKVRQALPLVLNRQDVLNIVLGPDGAELASDQPVAPVLRDHVDIPMKAQDLATAKQLLAEAGYPNGFEFDLPTQYGRRVAQKLGAHAATGVCAGRRQGQPRRRDVADLLRALDNRYHRCDGVGKSLDSQ